MTWPIVLSPRSSLIGDPNVDVWNHAWGPWWWFASLSEGELPWRTDYLIWPDGGVLWFIDPILGLLATPLVPIVGTAMAYNVALVLYVAFASWAAHRLARALGASSPAAWVASLAFAGSAWMISELHNGITEAADIGPVALALAWGHEATQKPTWKAWLLAGLGVGLATIASPYLGLGTGIALAVRGLPHIKKAWSGALVAVAVSTPALTLMKLQMAAEDAIIKHPPDMNQQLALHNAVDLRTFVQPFGFQSVDLSLEGFEHSMYLGIAALALALYSRRWKWWPSIIVCIAFALGPYIYVKEAGILPYRLPWWLVQSFAPGLAMTHPLRLAVPALALVAGLAGLGAHRLTTRWPRVLPVLLALVAIDGLVVSGAPWPMERAPAEIPAVYEHIARDLGSERAVGVLDLPTDAGYTMATSRYLYWQSSHHLPIVYAPDARSSTSSLLRTQFFRELAGTSERRADEAMHIITVVPHTRPEWMAQQAYDVGVRWIVLHRSMAQPEVEPLLESWMGPGTVVGDEVYWEVPLPREAPQVPGSR
ncbi:MAG TPA: hypothetical protein QGF58_13955 [Myxococcota bacterium]|nr:hypothetical protein [Myxococcota bacterium]